MEAVKKNLIYILIGFGAFFAAFVFLFHELFQGFLNQTVVLATSDNPIHYLFNQADGVQIDHAWRQLVLNGYGETGQQYLYSHLYRNTYVILIFLLLICFISVGIALYVYKNKKEKKQNEWILQSIKNGRFDYDNEILYSVFQIHQQYRNKIETLMKDIAVQNEEYENIAHQLKSSLSTVILNTDLIKEDEDTIKYKKRIIEELERSNKLLNQFLSGYKIRNHQKYLSFQVSDLQQVIHLAVDCVREDAKTKNIHFVKDIQSCYLAMDSFWMQEVIETILKNCIDFADKNSNIQIILNHVDNRILLEISDTGIPLDPSVDIFSRYETASCAKEHYGIGLHMAKQIIEQHFGTIHVESKGKQVKFFIHLPLHQLETFTY